MCQNYYYQSDTSLKNNKQTINQPKTTCMTGMPSNNVIASDMASVAAFYNAIHSPAAIAVQCDADISGIK